MTTLNPSLLFCVKKLKLSGILSTLPERLDYAQKTKLSFQDFLELILQDEIQRREHSNLSLRIQKAGFEEQCTFEQFDWNAPISFDRDKVKNLLNLQFIELCQDVLLVGPVGVGKTHLASSFGHAACRAGKSVLFIRSEHLLRQLNQARADLSLEKTFRKFLAPDLLIIDDFGLKRLDSRQSSDFYELIIERHKSSSTIITSNRAIDEWTSLFDDPILAQSALDRIAHNSYQIIIEGDSYRKRRRPSEVSSSSPTPAILKKKR